MRRKLNRLLSAFLTVSMILSDIGGMSAVNAANYEPFTTEVTAISENTVVEQTVSEDIPKEQMEPDDPTVIFEEPAAPEKEINGVVDPALEYRFTCYPVNGVYSTDLYITLHGSISEDQIPVRVYALYTDDASVDLNPDSVSINRSDLGNIKVSEGYAEFEESTSLILPIGSANDRLKPDTDYRCVLAGYDPDGENYCYFSDVIEFTTFPDIELHSTEINPGSYETELALWLDPCSDENIPAAVHQVCVYYTDDENLSVPADKRCISDNDLKGYKKADTDLVIAEDSVYYLKLSKLDASTDYKMLILSKLEDGTYRRLKDDDGFTTKDAVDMQVNIDPSAYSAQIDLQYEGIDGLKSGTQCVLVYTSDASLSMDEAIRFVDELNGFTTLEFTYYDYSSESHFTIGDTVPLKPSTDYRLRIAAQGAGYYCFISKVIAFTTAEGVSESVVSINNIYVQEYGYDREKISFSLVNPNNEKVMNLRIVDKEDNEAGNIYSNGSNYDNTITYYYSEINTDLGSDLFIAYDVYVGDGIKKEIKIPVPVQRQDSTKRKASISANTGKGTIIVSTDIDPYYNIDYYQLNVLYRQKGDESYGSQSFVGSMVAVLSDLTAGVEYECYVTVTSYSGKTTIAALGSAENPIVLIAGEEVIYTEEDFVDKGLYYALSKQYSELKSSVLERVTGLYVYEIYEKTPIRSLEDLQAKMPNLTSISIPGHDIKSLEPLMNLKFLNSLYLEGNDISSIPDLTETHWTDIYLGNNLITEEDWKKAKFPASFKYGSHGFRDEEFRALNKLYIDNNGKYPLILDFGGMKNNRNYSVSVNIAGVSKEFVLPKEYRGVTVVEDLKEEIPSLEEGIDYNLKAVIFDEYGNSFENSYTVRYDKLPVTVDDTYISSGMISTWITIRVPGQELELEEGCSVYAGIKKNGKTYMKTREDYLDCWGWDSIDDNLYREELKDRRYSLNYFNIDYSAKCYDFYVSPICMPEEGEYDAFMDFGDGRVYVSNGGIHITAETIINGYDIWTDDDYSGNDFYICLTGTNIGENTIPYIYDESGEEYTEFSGMSSDYDYDYEAISYRLKKKKNWDKIESASENTVYYIGVKGKYNDLKKLFPAEIYASDLKYMIEPGNIDIYSSVYNWKKAQFEFGLPSFMKGMTVNAEFSYENYDEETEEYTYTKVATGKGVVESDCVLRINAFGTDNKVFIPEDSKYIFVNLNATDKDGFTMTGNTEFYLRLFNYSEPTPAPDPSQPAPAPRMYAYSNTGSYLSKGEHSLQFTAYDVPAAHKTNELYIKMRGTNDAKKMEFVKAKTDYYTVKDWKVNLPEERYYYFDVYELVDGKEEVLCSASVRVLKDGFYQTSQYVNYYDEGTSATLSATLPLMYEGKGISDKKELQKFMTDNKLAVQVFDCDFEEIKNVKVELTSVATGSNLTFNISGLDKYYTGYYFKLTRDSKVAICAYDPDSTYYAANNYNEQYGIQAEKHGNIWFYGSGEIDGYCYINTQYCVGEAPLILDFYRFSDPYRKVLSITLTEKDIDNYNYAFTEEDFARLDPNTIYTCIVTSAFGRKSVETGYFVPYTKSVNDTAPVSSVQICGVSAMNVGDTLDLVAKVYPVNAIDKRVNWSSSNTKVAEISSSGTVTAISEGSTVITAVTISGNKTAKVTLNVIEKEKALYVEFAGDSFYTYTGDKITPKVNVYYKGELLKEDIDYTLSYSNNLNASENAEVSVKGKTIACSAKKKFTIMPQSLSNVRAVSTMVKAGKKATPVLYYGSYKLGSKDYDNPSAGIAFDKDTTIKLNGKGNFTGELDYKVTVGEPLSIRVKSFKPVKRSYTGESQLLTENELVVCDKGNNVLKKETDYTVIYLTDTKAAGTVKVVIAGIGKYTGTVQKSYKIATGKIVPSVKLNTEEIVFDPNGACPEVSVMDGEKILTIGKDYQLTYSGNKKVGNKATANIKFIGNYKGSKSIKKNYTIIAASLESAVVYCPDMAFVQDKKYVSKPYVMVNGVLLKASDYNVSYMLGSKDVNKTKLTSADMTDGKATITVTVTAKGKNYTGTATGSYDVVQSDASKDISRAKVTIKDKNGKSVNKFEFTGSPIEFNDDYSVEVILNNTKLSASDYTVTYVNNTNKGKAYVSVTGLGGYAG
ncbi:MAG: Ig-like domain-containing protein, partial [Lachnospiraceae bacterium]|nr:Ig-like domain-containing protein [Lachnospiraceae bacterium]